MKEFYQKNSSIIHWGILGLIIGLIPTILAFTPLAVLGLMVGLPAFFVYGIFTGVGEPFDVGYGFFILTPFLYTAVGLFFGWIIGRFSKYVFNQEVDINIPVVDNQELNANVLVGKKKIIRIMVIFGGIIGFVIGFLTHIGSPWQFVSGFMFMFVGAFIGLIVGVIIIAKKK
ncbi:MAG: hypothetical protein WCV52_02225 [Candidatus Paceibacterota bacterium]